MSASAGRLRAWTTVAAVAAIALSSLWVMEVMRQQTDDTLPAPRRTAPDYFVEGFRYVRMTPAGLPQYTVSGDRLTHYPVDDSSVINRPILRDLSSDKPPMTVTSDQARVERGNSKVHMMGNVKADRPASAKEDRLHIETEYALILPDEDILRGDKPVTIRLGQSVLRGTGMVVNNATRRFELLGNVRGTYIAPSP